VKVLNNGTLYGLEDLVTGTCFYMGGNPGEITDVSTNKSGVVHQRIGVALNDVTMFFSIGEPVEMC